MNDMFRKLAVGVVVSVLTATAHSGDRIDVWVLLTEPPVASGTSTPESVKKQQQAVMAELEALGAVELGRVSTALNAAYFMPIVYAVPDFELRTAAE